MAIKVIAQRREVKLGKKPGMKFVMRPDLYIPIAEKKVFSETAIPEATKGADSMDAVGPLYLLQSSSFLMAQKRKKGGYGLFLAKK
jgi:hypothetical protein